MRTELLRSLHLSIAALPTVSTSPGTLSTMPDTASGSINVQVSTLTGKTMQLDWPYDSTVDELKRMIQDREGIPPDQQRFIWTGIELKAEKARAGTHDVAFITSAHAQLLSDYRIPAGAKVYVILRLRGGGTAVRFKLALS